MNTSFSSSKNILLLALVLMVQNCFAQIDKAAPGSWGMLFSQMRLHNKWSIHSEVQFRSYEINPNTEQMILRAGINFHYNPNIIFTAGYGWITNYKNNGEIIKSQAVNENRVWEQVVLKSSSGRLFFEHRYRFEQRWIETAGKMNYKNRIRYLFRTTIPINHKEIKKNTLFIAVYDELFIHLTNTPWDRNRLYGALGFQFSPSLNVQVGYLLQTAGTQSKQYLQVGINYNPDLRKSK